MLAILVACVLHTTSMPAPPAVLFPALPPIVKSRGPQHYLPQAQSPPPMDVVCDGMHPAK